MVSMVGVGVASAQQQKLLQCGHGGSAAFAFNLMICVRCRSISINACELQPHPCEPLYTFNYATVLSKLVLLEKVPSVVLLH